MIRSKSLIFISLCTCFFIAITSCSDVTTSDGDLSETLDPIAEVYPIEGAENSRLTVNKGSNSYFKLAFAGISSNSIITEAEEKIGWCIDWEKPIDSDNGVYDNIPLLSTFNVEKWNRLNYLLNISNDLMASDPEITFREIQLVVWSLRGFPEFNLNSTPVADLPSRMKDANGQPNFSYEKVDEILEIVENGHDDFEFVEGTKYAVIAQTPSDVQTVIAVAE